MDMGGAHTSAPATPGSTGAETAGAVSCACVEGVHMQHMIKMSSWAARAACVN